MSKSMVLTLGHNASAIVVENGNILGGYEEERFTCVKSDSSFPKQAIAALVGQFGSTYDDVCIGHWFTNGAIGPSKYIDGDIVVALTNGVGDVHSINDGLTHHDTHLLSAQVFAKHHGFDSQHTAIVADGFGTFGECISIYRCDSRGHQLIRRFFGYERSLGMLYQYATAYLGMKMNNHEYKMLGYEAHILKTLGSLGNSEDLLLALNQLIDKDASDRVADLLSGEIIRDTDPIVNKAALAAAQFKINATLDGILEYLELDNLLLHDKRVVIAYYVQSIVETVMSRLVAMYRPKNLLVAGGLFYNVKLNHVLTEQVESFCAMPLAGDQGAGLGVYQHIHGDLKWPGHLAWGHRDLSKVTHGNGIIVVQSEASAMKIAMSELATFGMVNIVRGSMEFGPRSLCNTATIAIPSLSVIDRINRMNDRTTVMPMAPAMTPDQANQYLEDTGKVVGSLDYMICTRDLHPHTVESVSGAAHHYPIFGKHTCRPQIIGQSDQLMTALLNRFGPLINTSFNYHGVPIAFDAESIEYSHAMQRKFEQITTIVII